MFLSKKCHPPAGCVPCSLWMTLFLSSYSFLVLSVISIYTMLTVIVFILQLLRCRLDSRVDGLGTVCHFGNLFEDNSIVNSLMRIFAQVNGPWFLQRTAGTAFTSFPIRLNSLTIRWPVFSSYASSISSFVRQRRHGTSP